MTPARERRWLIATLRANAVRLEGLTYVDGVDAALVLAQTGRATEPVKFWSRLLEANGVPVDPANQGGAVGVTDPDDFVRRWKARGWAVEE